MAGTTPRAGCTSRSVFFHIAQEAHADEPVRPSRARGPNRPWSSQPGGRRRSRRRGGAGADPRLPNRVRRGLAPRTRCLPRRRAGQPRARARLGAGPGARGARRLRARQQPQRRGHLADPAAPLGRGCAGTHRAAERGDHPGAPRCDSCPNTARTSRRTGSFASSRQPDGRSLQWAIVDPRGETAAYSYGFE